MALVGLFVLDVSADSHLVKSIILQSTFSIQIARFLLFKGSNCNHQYREGCLVHSLGWSSTVLKIVILFAKNADQSHLRMSTVCMCSLQVAMLLTRNMMVMAVCWLCALSDESPHGGAVYGGESEPSGTLFCLRTKKKLPPHRIGILPFDVFLKAIENRCFASVHYTMQSHIGRTSP